MMPEILNAYNLQASNCRITPIGNGLINTTWKVSCEQDFILQKINTTVFKNPNAIAQNIRLIADYLAQQHPDYLFTAPIKTVSGAELVFIPDQGYFRLFPFVRDSFSFDVVHSPKQAFEAARQFGKFTRLLQDFDVHQLQTTIPDFHNLSLRYQQFLEALEHGNSERQAKASESILFLQQQKDVVTRYEDLKKSPWFNVRVTHHDTKISNVLFDAGDNGICIIDLDTVMPGYFISDVGDMLRTYLSPVSEEEKDLSKITIRDEYFQAIVSGYFRQMQSELSMEEKEQVVYAGKFMVYMQALRFLTDYLNNDVYYGSAYDGHNLVRANNQITLLQQLNEHEPHLQRLVKKL